MDRVNKKAVIQKAKFYWQEKLKCHVKKIPTGFLNGFIKSDLLNDAFYWFEDLRTLGKTERLFLNDIFDIKDYEEVIEEWKTKLVILKNGRNLKNWDGFDENFFC